MHFVDFDYEQLYCLFPLNDAFQKPKIGHKRRVIKALRSFMLADEPCSQAIILADRIEGCSKCCLCSTPWCSRCRSKAAKGLQRRILNHLREEFGDDDAAARERLIFVTPLFDLVAIQDIRRVKAVIRQARADLKALTRKFNGLWMQGAFEIEVIDFPALIEWNGANQTKRQTIAAMLQWDGNAAVLRMRPPLVLIHAHFLLDAGEADRDAIEQWIAKRFGKVERQVRCERVWVDQTFEDMSWKIGSYPFKDRVQFNMTFESKFYRNGGYLSDYELARMALLHNSICLNGWKNLLISSKTCSTT